MTDLDLQLRLSKLRKRSLNKEEDCKEFVLLCRKVIALKKTPTNFMFVGIIFDIVAGMFMRINGYSNNCDHFDAFASIDVDEIFTVSSFMRSPNAICLQKSSKFALRGSRNHLFNNSVLSGLSSCRSDSHPFISEPLSVTSVRLCERHLVVCRFCSGSFEGDACINCSRTEQKIAFSCVLHLSDETMTIRCLVEDTICMNLLGVAEDEILDAIEDGCLKVFIETQSIDKLGKFCYLLSEIPKHAGRTNDERLFRVDRFFKSQDFEQNTEATKRRAKNSKP